MKNLPIDWRRVLLIAGVLFLVLVIIEFNSRLEQLDKLNRQVDITRAEATQAAQTQFVLETKVANTNADQIVEEQARSEGRMILEGDNPITILGDEEASPSSDPNPTPIPTAKPNWQKWRDLYFGEE